MAKKKTIMRAFKIDEISAVDRPAQSGAKKVLMKRGDTIIDDDLNKSATDYAYVPDENNSDTWELPLTSKSFVDKAAAAIEKGFRNELSATEHAAIVDKVAKAWLAANPGKTESDLPKSLNKSTNPKETDMTQAEIDALKKAHTDALAAKEAELAKAKKTSELTDAEKAKMKSMNDNDADDFLNKSAEERAAIMKNDVDSNPVVYKSASGDEFRKNDDARLVKMAKEADENAKIAKAANEALKLNELKKRANEEFKYLPGTEVEKAELLKSIDAIPDEAVRASVLKSVKAGDNALSAAFTRKGAGGGSNTDNSATDKLDELAKAYQKDNKVTYAKAYDAVMQTPEGSELYAASLVK